VSTDGLTEMMTSRRIKYYVDIEGMIISKECSKCSEIKLLEEYSKHKEKLGGVDPVCKSCRAGYRQQNKQQIADYYTTWKSDNGEVKSQIDKKWRKNNKERAAENCRRWRVNNLDKSIENQRKWLRNNRDKKALIDQRRRARKLSLPDDFNSHHMEEALAYFGGCSLTGVSDEIHWDHAIPLATGNGGTTKENMIPLRGDLNQSKKDSNIFEWFISNHKRFELEQWRFDRLIEWLSKANGMTVEEYRDYVYECHTNTNILNDAKATK
jgi:hypothetical protein